uniref:Putative secreted protein n=1 Tax=Panstrongylus lignarius TaxID=156445 RepID=A0A224Y628_9HEMI
MCYHYYSILDIALVVPVVLVVVVEVHGEQQQLKSQLGHGAVVPEVVVVLQELLRPLHFGQNHQINTEQHHHL